MDAAVADQIRRCAEASLAGTLSFPEIVAQLASVGVERYHADYSRSEATYYLANGESLVVPLNHASHAIGVEFQQPAIEAAIRQSQRNEHRYVDFLTKTMAAGCVGYFVQITGRQAIYFGRNGESHVEPFPSR